MRLLLAPMLLAPTLLAEAPRLPLRFERNLGQAPEEVKFLWRGGAGESLFLASRSVVLRRGSETLRLEFAGSTPAAPRGLDPLAARTHYLLGNDPAQWRTDIPNFARVRLEGLYPGIDAVFYGNAGQELEHDFIVSPGADPGRIELESSVPARLEPGGDLRLGGFRLKKPRLYQEVAGQRRLVQGRYRVRGRRIGFEVASWDRRHPLVIDPVLAYSSFFGGTGGSSAESLVLDAEGNIYLTGTTTSNHFPTKEPLQEFFQGSNEVFVTKLDPTGSTLIYSTYLGSWGDDKATAIAVDAAGAVYVAGYTTSPAFPTVNPVQRDFLGGSLANGGDAFVFKLNPAGSGLVYSTYLGGSADDFARGIAVDGEGNVIVAGSTASYDFPVVNALQDFHGGGTRDVFVARLNAAGSELLFSTYLGGAVVDEANAVAIDPEGAIYLHGNTTSLDFPRLHAVQPVYAAGARDTFLTKMKADGSALVYSTYLGGTGDDFARGITVDAEGHVYITGYTGSNQWPVVEPIQRTRNGGRDVYLTKLRPDGSGFVYSTFFGGANNDEGFSVALDPAGNAYVTGLTQSLNFPAVGSFHTANGGACTRPACTNDVFALKVSPDGRSLIYSTYLGGTAAEQPRGIRADALGNAYIAGQTASVNFPVVAPFQSVHDGGGTAIAFLVRIGDPR